MKEQIDMTVYEKVVADYIQALDAGDIEAILLCFADGAVVNSPFLGIMPAHEFFPKVLESSTKSDITLYDILLSAQGQPRAIGYFNYDWTLRDGSKVVFDVADVFDFDHDGRISSMIILYDTHPIREQVGNKYG